MEINQSGRYVLFMSIFYSEQSWAQMVRICILPSMEHLKSTWNCNFLVHFSTHRGACVNLTIWMNAERRGEVIDFVYKSINEYLVKYPSLKKAENEVKLFQDFENNSIHFKLHNFVPALKSNRTFICPFFWQHITNSLLLDIRDFDVSIDSIQTLSLYLFLLIILSDSEILDEFLDTMKQPGTLLGNDTDTALLYLESAQHLQEIKKNCEQMLAGEIGEDEYNVYQMYLHCGNFLNGTYIDDAGSRIRKYTLFLYLLTNLRRVFCIDAKIGYINDFILYKTLSTNNS